MNQGEMTQPLKAVDHNTVVVNEALRCIITEVKKLSAETARINSIMVSTIVPSPCIDREDFKGTTDDSCMVSNVFGVNYALSYLLVDIEEMEQSLATYDLVNSIKDVIEEAKTKANQVGGSVFDSAKNSFALAISIRDAITSGTGEICRRVLGNLEDAAKYLSFPDFEQATCLLSEVMQISAVVEQIRDALEFRQNVLRRLSCPEVNTSADTKLMSEAIKISSNVGM